VREDHSGDGEPVNALVAVTLDGDGRGHVEVVASGYDFYSTPRISPDGRLLSWLCWNHPEMPWDGTELWIAEISTLGVLERARCVAGSSAESIYQPGWSPDGALYFASDCSGWWQLYRLDSPLGSGCAPRLAINHPANAEFGRANWDFGTRTWVAAGPDRLVVSYTTRGRWRLATVDIGTGRFTDLAAGIEPHQWLAADGTHVVLVGSSTTASASVVRIHLASGRVETLRPAEASSVPTEFISQPAAIECPGTGGRSVHAFYYPPSNRDAAPPEGERPPLIAISHGGPTTATSDTLDLRVQYWTSRGFAVVDVNYGGSTGYGRAYRERLKGAWGIVDVEDVISVVRHLASEGKADADRLIIRGGSAGGYTTLAALAFHPDVFRAGASYYGVSDLEALARDTHKFESRYLDSLIGPYPAMRDEYRKRSPVHFPDRLSCALIFFQGLEDRVVPPDQSASMAEAVRRKGLPVEYLTFAGEQHGFRRAETIVRCLEAELDFYGRVFGLGATQDTKVGPRRTR
jgi:dipeptidyl aminopeptidase/acylaminoacyl peptidase